MALAKDCEFVNLLWCVIRRKAYPQIIFVEKNQRSHKQIADKDRKSFEN